MSIKKSLLVIFVSAFCTCGLFFGCFFLMQWSAKLQRASGIEKIVLHTQESELLSPQLFAYYLGLSANTLTPLVDFDLSPAKSELLQKLPLKSIRLKKRKPDQLWIAYELKRPLAILGNASNTLIDTEGSLMPYKPFYSPKKIPTIYLQQERQMQEEELACCKRIFALLEDRELTILDLRWICHASKAKRGVVVALGTEGATHTLRLTVEGYEEELLAYLQLKKRFLESNRPYILDFRFKNALYLSS